MPNKKKFPLSGLSKQQKLILSLLEGSTEQKPYSSMEISWMVAKKFDNDGGDRILYRSRKKVIEETREKVRKREISPREGSDFVKFYTQLHRKDMKENILTHKHRISISKTLKRLTERGLIGREHYQISDMGDESHHIKYYLL